MRTHEEILAQMEILRAKTQRQTPQQRMMAVYGFEAFCESQRNRILRQFTNTVTDKDLPMEQVEAKWKTVRLGPSLNRYDFFKDDDNPDSVNMEVRR